MVVNPVTKIAFMEYKNSVDGVFEEKEDIEYKGSFEADILARRLNNLSRAAELNSIRLELNEKVISVAREKAYYKDTGRFSRNYLRFLGAPSESKAYMQGKLIGESWLEDITLGYNEMRIISVKDEIFKTEKGEDARSASRVIKNGVGLVLEDWFGSRNENGEFIRNQGDIRIYRYYNGLAKYSLAQFTVTTVLNDRAEEEFFSFANFTKLNPNNGDVSYVANKGLSKFRLERDALENRRELEIYIRNKAGNIFDKVLFAWLVSP